VSQLLDKINSFVSEKLDSYQKSNQSVRPSTTNKIIHDTILGTNIFYPHEMEIIDSPLIQRLRRISQMDVVSYIFPSANHNRFEHSLGVAIIADKIANSLYREKKLGEAEYKCFMYHVRLAGILHDVGHCAFSHMSEEIYSTMQDIADLKKEKKFADASPHEIISNLIITSDAFRSFFANFICIRHTYLQPYKIDLDLIGKMVVGYTLDDPDKAFWIETINGFFDADKLDYIQRDSYYSGIQMNLDLDRLFHTIDLIEIEGKKRLAIKFNGVTILEQIVFCKLMLISRVYNHQKVRAAECLFKSLIKLIINKQKSSEIKISCVTDFLSYTDDAFYSLAITSQDKEIKQLAENLIYRSLPKRALVITGRSIDKKENLISITKLCDDPKFTNYLKNEIVKECQKEEPTIAELDVWIDIPKPALFKEGIETPIKIAQDNDVEYVTFSDIFPISDWTKAFNEYKWQAHVFTYPKFVGIVSKVSKEIFEKVFDLQFNDINDKICKIE